MSNSYISDLSSQIQTYIVDKDYESINGLLDSSLNIILNNINSSSSYSLTTEEQNILSDANTFKIFLQNQNKLQSSKLMSVLASVPDDMDGVVDDYLNIKNESSLAKEQNKTTTKTFVEKYLYIIIKIIFFMVVIILLFYSFFNDNSGNKSMNPFSNLINFNNIKNLFNRENTVVAQKPPQAPKVNKPISSVDETITMPASNNTLFPIKNTSNTPVINTKN